MTEAVRRARRPPRETRARELAERVSEAPKSDLAAGAAESERRMARRVAQISPVATIVAAGAVGVLTSIGPAILVLAGGALFATIAFFWASLRTLGGDAPLAKGFDRMARRKIEASDGAAERKRTAMRALKDLEFEHSIGKIDDADYAEISSRYREQAKAILREMEKESLPLRERAEQLARAYLAKRGAKGGAGAAPATKKGEIEPSDGMQRQVCTECRASNEPDAIFCKGCGARLASKGCPACATINEKDAVFCKKCGGSLDPHRTEKVDASA
jgi:ribosomal protein L40E